MEKSKEFLALYSANCKRCKYLDSQEKKKFTSCHFSKGNRHCPASDIQMVVVGKAYRYAKIVIAARDARDAGREAKILSTVSKQSAEFQERFYAALENPSEISEL